MINENVPVGRILTDEKVGRDAIHIPVIPMLVGHTVKPGDHVGILDSEASALAEEKVGIIDPFITAPHIFKGQKVLVFLYPGSVTSLRHIWTHPAFAVKVPPKPNSEKQDE